MKIRRVLVMLLALAVLLSGCAGAPEVEPLPSATAAPPAEPPAAAPTPAGIDVQAMEDEAVVSAFLRLFYDEEYDAALPMMTQEVIDQLNTMGGLQALAAALMLQTGKLNSMADAIMLTVQGDNTLYQALLTMEKGNFAAQVALTPDKKVAGFGIVPGAEDPVEMPEGFAEETIVIDAGAGFPLEGKLVVPAGGAASVAGVVLVQGSGATDYDEIVGANRVFGQLARGLAKQGIASLRYTKRNHAYPNIQQEKEYSIEAEYVEDVLAAVAFMGEVPGVDADRVFLLGHSMGGMLAPLFVERGADVAGMVLLAGSPRSLMDIMIDQQELNLAASVAQGAPQEQVDQYRKMQEQWELERKNLETLTAEQAMEAGTVYGFGAYYMYVLNQYDAIETIRSLKKPILILQGGNDFQVFAHTDYEAYGEAIGKEDYVQMKLYDRLNHLFMPSHAQDLLSAMNEYYVPAQIPDEVFSDIAHWAENAVASNPSP